MNCIDDKYYHVYNRGAHKEKIYLTDFHYEYCLRLIAKYCDVYNVSIAGYCLMPNHYHLMVRQNGGGSISKFIQTTFNAYTQGFNKISSHSGTLFQGRAKKILIDSDDYALQLIRYIHLNPVKAKLVQCPEEWEYSNYRIWAGFKSNVFSDLTLRDGYFKGADDYKEFIDSYNGLDDISKYLLE